MVLVLLFLLTLAEHGFHDNFYDFSFFFFGILNIFFSHLLYVVYYIYDTSPTLQFPSHSLLIVRYWTTCRLILARGAAPTVFSRVFKSSWETTS